MPKYDEFDVDERNAHNAQISFRLPNIVSAYGEPQKITVCVRKVFYGFLEEVEKSES